MDRIRGCRVCITKGCHKRADFYDPNEHILIFCSLHATDTFTSYHREKRKISENRNAGDSRLTKIRKIEERVELENEDDKDETDDENVRNDMDETDDENMISFKNAPAVQVEPLKTLQFNQLRFRQFQFR